MPSRQNGILRGYIAIEGCQYPGRHQRTSVLDVCTLRRRWKWSRPGVSVTACAKWKCPPADAAQRDNTMPVSFAAGRKVSSTRCRYAPRRPPWSGIWGSLASMGYFNWGVTVGKARLYRRGVRAELSRPLQAAYCGSSASRSRPVARHFVLLRKKVPKKRRPWSVPSLRSSNLRARRRWGYEENTKLRFGEIYASASIGTWPSCLQVVGHIAK